MAAKTDAEVIIGGKVLTLCGYESEDTYVFPSMEEVEKFLGMRNDYENHIYYQGEDIYGTKRSIGYSEFIDVIYSRTDYEVDWRDDNE